MPLTSLSAHFSWLDWLIVFGYLALTTALGATMAGKQATIRDFFLGGRTLPWWAISGSIIATEISALTFVSVPWIVFQPGGNLTYLQLGVIGSVLARCIVGYWLVPAYYEREIYSPYDYMGERLGHSVRGLTTVLFAFSGLLGQAARIYLTAEVVIVVLNEQLQWLAATVGLNPLAWAIILISAISIAWTLMGGMHTVIWTDVALFIAFAAGAAIALGAVVLKLDGGWGELMEVGLAAKESGGWGKLTFLNASPDPTRSFTIWTAMIASTWGGVGAYGTDQLMAQRMFCCRTPREARWAIISSSASLLVTTAVALVGVGLFAYYKAHPLEGTALALFQERGDRIFPIFIVQALPIGLKGVIIAAIFAAAISSVMGILTALSQTVQTAFVQPRLKVSGSSGRVELAIGRGLVVIWGVLLSVLAYLAAYAAEKYPSILELGLSFAGYCGGALLAGFALAFFRFRVDGSGYLWSAPLSVLWIFAIAWHQPWSQRVCWIGAGLLLAAWIARELSLDRRARAGRRTHAGLQFLLVIAALAGVIATSHYGHFGAGPPDKLGQTTFKVLAWPWYTPIGSVIAVFFGYWLARRPSVAGGRGAEPRIGGGGR